MELLVSASLNAEVHWESHCEVTRMDLNAMGNVCQEKAYHALFVLGPEARSFRV